MKALQIIILSSLFIAGSAVAAPVTASDKTQQIVNELKRLTEQAERDRSASHRFIDQLEALIARYEWPWQRRVLFDNFRDGDFVRNPVWHTNSDDFWVRANLGLRSEVEASHSSGYSDRPRRDRNPSPEGVILDMLLGGDGAAIDPERRRFQQRTDISTGVQITNAFAITLNLTDLARHNRSHNNRTGAFEFGPYQGTNMESGYRLIYQNGNNPALLLIRYRHNIRSAIARYDRGRLLSDGNMHAIRWLRSADGTMRVLIDGREVMQARDRDYRNAFSGFVMTNRGGDYAIRSVSIHADNRQIRPIRGTRSAPLSIQ